MPAIVETDQDTKHQGCGGRLVSLDGRSLPLREAALAAEAAGGLARCVLRQRFRNAHTEPLEVLYTFPLPAEGAVAAYEFRIGDRRVVGRIDRRAAAREQYEQALVEGRTAGLVDQERDNLFTQRLGNVPPGVEVEVDLRIDQKLRWLPEGLWEWRFPTVTAPRYLGEAGRIADAGEVSVDVAEGGTGMRVSLDLVVRDLLPEGGAPVSPSHAILTGSPETGTAAGPGGGARVVLADDGAARLDRDVVVRWPVAHVADGVTLLCARPGAGTVLRDHAYGLLSIVPPERAGATLHRDLIVLIDTSGSMSGRPIHLAKAVMKELIAALAPTDRLEMIAFSNTPQRWQRSAVEVTPKSGRAAAGWVDALAARGGTEMTRAVEEALQPLRGDGQRQVVLVTDGQVGFEAEVFRAIRDLLPAGSRLHTVGVGSAVNEALLGPAARAGRGVEVLIGLDEPAAPGVARLVAATRAPVLIDVVIDGPAVTGTAPRRLPDLLAGAPLLASVRLSPGGGTLRVRGRTAAGPWERTIDVPPTAAGAGSEGVTALYGREAVADLELDRAAGAEASEIDPAVERIGLEFGISTRLTSWIAVSEEPTVDPRRPVKVVRIPQELPYGLCAEGLGLRGRMSHAVGPAHRMERLAAASMHDRVSLVGVLGSWRRSPRQKDRMEQDVVVPVRRFAARWVPGPEPGTRVLVFEVVGDRIKWRPVTTAVVVLRSGARVVADVVAALTTVAGAVDAGTLVRIGLRLNGHDPVEILAIEIVSDGRLLRLEP